MKAEIGFKKAEILRCGSVRFSVIAHPSVGFGAVIYILSCSLFEK